MGPGVCTMINLMYGTRRRAWVRLTAVLAVGLFGILIAAPNASGQAAIDQYVPQGNPAAAPGGAQSGSPDATLGTQGTGLTHKIAAKPESGSHSGGTLPLSDYPVTPFVWIIIASLVVGALVRVAAPVLERGGARGAS